MWETTVMHKQVSGSTVNFGPNFPESPFLESQTRKPPPPPFRKTSDLGWPKFTLEYPPHFGKLQIWDDQSSLRNTPHFGKLQIWDDQSLLWNTPHISENFRLGMTKVYSRIPPPPFRKTSDLGWPKFTLEYPPILENFRLGMTKVYSRIPPPFWKTSDLGWPKFTLEYPPFWKTSDLGWPKFTPEYPPHFGKLQIWDDQSSLRNTPHFGKLQTWDDQSLLRNTPPFWKTSDLGWPKFTPEYPPISENFRFGMTKVHSGIPPHFGKLQIWDDQSLLRNTPHISENFRFGMIKVHSGIPSPPFWKTSDLGWPKFTPEYPPPREFKNAESYYMWRLYPTRITTRFMNCVYVYIDQTTRHRLDWLHRYSVHRAHMYVGFMTRNITWYLLLEKTKKRETLLP